MAGFIGVTAAPALADPILSASDVSAAITAPPSAGASFPATGTIKNTGLFTQNPGSTLTISANGGSVTVAPAGCTLGSGQAVCTAGALAPGLSESWTVTVVPNAGATSVISTADAVAANGEVNALPDSANNSASATTAITYTVDASISSQPSTVRNGDDTLLNVGVKNTAATQSITVSVATGGTYDPQLALPAGCAPNGSGTTVTCTHAYAPGQTRSFDIAVTTPTSGSSITSTATATGAVGGSDSASVVTNLYSDATAFVPEGDSLAGLFPAHTSNFAVPTGSAPGLFLDLNEVTLTATMCGTTLCNSKAAEALFPNSGTYSGSDPAHPFVWDISYGKLTCNGNGAPKCTDVLYYIPSGSTLATKMPKCQTFGGATATLTNVNQVCLQNATKIGTGWTFQVGLLRDIVIPIISGVSNK